MAKKLNKKVAVIGISILSIFVVVVGALGIRHFVGRNPETNLQKARQAIADGDYKRAETLLGKSYAYGKTDVWKIERLFEMAEFHLIQNDQHEASWPKALRCWNTVLNINPKNTQARRKMMQYFYAMADSGAAAAWKNVYEQATELKKIFGEQGTEPDTEQQQALGRSALAIARIGGTTAIADYQKESLAVFEALIEREPTNASYYSYLADAILLGGQLDEQGGLVGAAETARTKALAVMEDAVKNADDKTEAWANLYTYKLQNAAADADAVELLRKDITQKTEEVGQSSRLLTLLSQAYEIPGKGDAKSELNLAIEAARGAYGLSPNEFETGYRLVLLLYRKGLAFEDAASLEDALTLAEDLKTIPQTQDIPGPQQGRNLAYRNVLNVFLARIYLDRAAQQTQESADWTAKAEPVVKQIGEYFNSSEHPTVQQWQGMLSVAQGKRDLGIRLMHKAYEQAKTLDKPNQPSTIDPLLCLALTKIARQEGEIGLEREYLEKALNNRSRIAQDNPSLILDYAELMMRLQVWAQAGQYVQTYQQRYGATDRSRRLMAEAALATGQENIVKDILASLPENSPEQKQLELRFIGSQINGIQRQLAAPEAERKTPESELKKKNEMLRARQRSLITEMIQTMPEAVDPALVQSVSAYLLTADQKTDAVALMDAFLAVNPEMIGVQMLRRQADEPNPVEIPVERYRQLQTEVFEKMADPKRHAMAMAAMMRAEGQYDKAAEWFDKAAKADKDNDADVIGEQFDMAIDQQDVKTAESLLRVFRSRNLDGCDGAMAAAQVEALKKDFPLALRRIDEALAIRPLLSKGYFLKSRVYEQMSDSINAVQNAQRAAQMNPLNSLYAKNYASILFNRNSALGSRVTEEQNNELIGAITLAVVLNPNDWQLQSVYAEVIGGQSPDRALAIRQQLLRTYPTGGNAVMLGNMAMRMAQAERDRVKKSGLIELAGKAYTQAMTLEPDNEGVKGAYAKYLRQTQQSEKAEELLRDDQNLLWRYYLQNSQFDKAEQVLGELHNANPKDPVVLRGLILTAEGKGNRESIKKFLDLLSNGKLEKDDELWAIQKYLDNGYADETANRLASFKERYPNEKLVLLLEAWYKMTLGQLNDALSLSNQYLESDSDNAGAWRLRGRLNRLMNDPRKAVDDLQRSKALAANPAVSQELATLYSEMGQIDAAIGELVTGLQNPQAPLQLQLMLESLYQRNNRASDLERFYTQNITTYSDSPFWYFRAAQYYLSKNDAARAVGYAKSGLKIAQTLNAVDPASLHLYLNALIENNKYSDVAAAAGDWIDGPLAPVAYANMAVAQFKLGQQDKAETFFFTALDKSGSADLFQEKVLSLMVDTMGQEAANRWIQKNPTALPNLLAAYRLAARNEQYNRGVELMDQCLAKTTPEQPQWVGLTFKKANLLTQAYAKTSDRDYLNKAIDLFEQILKIYPNNPSILNNLAYMMAANNQQIEQALQYARQAHQNDPGNPVYLDTYGFAQLKAGQSKPAEESILRALHLYDVVGEPIPWDVYNHLGMAQEALDEPVKALESFQKALSLTVNASEKDRNELQTKINKLKTQTNAL